MEESEFWQTGLVRVLRANLDGYVLGRVAMGETRGGKGAPYILLDPTPEDEAIADAWLAKHKGEL